MESLTLIIQKLCVGLTTKLPPLADGAGRRGRSILFTSAHAGEGKTFIAGAVALHLSKLGNDRVLLVDANFDRPQVHQRFKVPVGKGFYGCLKEGSFDADARFRSDVTDLDILVAGEKCDASILFNQQRVSGFLEAANREYNWVIFDGDRLSGGGSNALSRAVDGIVLVVDSRKTRRQVVKDAVDGLQVPPERILGVVLNKRKYEIPSLFYRWV